jgi:hypothetical protein
MRAKDHDLGRPIRAANLHVNVPHRNAVRRIRLNRTLKSKRRELPFNIFRRRLQRIRTPDMALADVSGEHFDVPPKALAKFGIRWLHVDVRQR